VRGPAGGRTSRCAWGCAWARAGQLWAEPDRTDNDAAAAPPIPGAGVISVPMGRRTVIAVPRRIARSVTIETAPPPAVVVGTALHLHDVRRRHWRLRRRGRRRIGRHHAKSREQRRRNEYVRHHHLHLVARLPATLRRCRAAPGKENGASPDRFRSVPQPAPAQDHPPRRADGLDRIMFTRAHGGAASCASACTPELLKPSC
jgi:hypothetical protein